MRRNFIPLHHFAARREGWPSKILPVNIDLVCFHLVAADKVSISVAVRAISGEIEADHALFWNILDHPAVGAEVQTPDLLKCDVERHVDSVEYRGRQRASRIAGRDRIGWPGRRCRAGWPIRFL